MNAIVAVNESWGIGKEDALLVNLSPDLKRFRQLTTGGTVIVGRKTLKTFPRGKPLPKRENIVLSRRSDLVIPGAVICGSVEEVCAAIAEKDPGTVFVIGGASVYKAFLPLCNQVFVTQFRGGEQADSFFPNLDEDPCWKAAETGPWQEFEGIPFRYVLYQRISADM